MDPVLDELEVPLDALAAAHAGGGKIDVTVVADRASACFTKGYGKFPRGTGPLLRIGDGDDNFEVPARQGMWEVVSIYKLKCQNDPGRARSNDRAKSPKSVGVQESSEETVFAIILDYDMRLSSDVFDEVMRHNHLFMFSFQKSGRTHSR